MCWPEAQYWYLPVLASHTWCLQTLLNMLGPQYILKAIVVHIMVNLKLCNTLLSIFMDCSKKPVELGYSCQGGIFDIHGSRQVTFYLEDADITLWIYHLPIKKFQHKSTLNAKVNIWALELIIYRINLSLLRALKYSADTFSQLSDFDVTEQN